MVVIAWHVLATGKPYHELGEDYFIDRRDPDKERRSSSWRFCARSCAKSLSAPA
jgi:hypothetical protein